MSDPRDRGEINGTDGAMTLCERSTSALKDNGAQKQAHAFRHNL